MNLRSRAGLWCVLVLSLATAAAAQTLTFEPLVTGTAMSRLAVGPDGDIYAASGATIRRVTPSGSSSVYVGTGVSGYLDGPRTTARLSVVIGMVFDAQGRLVFVDSGNHVVRRVESDGTVTTIAGTPQVAGHVNGPALSARFYYPYGLAIAGDGTMYVVDNYNHAIRKIATDGTVTTFAGGTYGTTNGTGTSARFQNPETIVIDANGDLLVADTYGQTIRKVTPGAVVTTVAGAANVVNYANGAATTTARFGYPHNIAVMADGTVLIADEYYALRAFKNGTVTGIAGDGINGGTRSGTGTYARFGMPKGLAESGGIVYLTDTNGVLWRGGPSLTDRPAVDLNPAPYLQERQLSVTGQSATTFTWSLAAKPTGSQVTLASNSTTPTITPDYNGTYSIVLVARSAAGSTITGLDLVATCTDAPTPNITTDTQKSCPGSPVTLDAGAGYTEYRWSTGATTRTITVSPTFDTYYSVTALVGTCVSASDWLVQDVYAVTNNVTTVTSGPLTVCGNGSSTNYIEVFPMAGTVTTGDVLSYQWGYRTTAGGPITPLAGETAKKYLVALNDFPAAGEYRVVCTVKPPCGGAEIITPDTVVRVREPLTVDFTPAQSYYCVNGNNVNTPVSVSAQAHGGNGGPYTYEWRKNGFGYRTDYLLTGPSTVSTDGGSWTLRIYNDFCEIFVNVPVSSYPAPSTPNVVTSSKTCLGGSRTLYVDYPNYPNAHYVWSNGATGTQITVTQPGTYSVARVDNVSGCSTSSGGYGIEFYDKPPVPNITPSGPTTFCPGGSVTLTSDPAAGYAWSNGAATQSITVSTPGTYTVSVRNANFCYTASAPVSVTVNPLPDATVTPSGPTTFCAGGSVTLTAPAGLTYLWSNGATTQSIAATASGGYSVTVTNANGCSKTSAATNVTVNPLPAATIFAEGPTTFCQGGSVSLTAPFAAGGTYLWSNGGTTRSISVNQSGSYSVTVTNANGCSATSQPAPVTVNPLPDATVTPSGPTTFCAGGSVTLSAPAGNTYLWSNGATTQSITVSASGSYGVTVTNGNGCSKASAPTTVAVNPLPDATVTPGGPTMFCAGGSVTLIAPAGLTYVWSNGATTRSITVSASGSYGVTVTNANGCSKTSAATPVVVNALPDATVTADGPTTFCAGGSVTLSAPAGNTYLWSNGATTQSITVSTPGSYGVTVTNANGCSTASSATAVAVNALPDATVTPDGPTTFCEGGSVTLSAPAGLSYLWSNGATTQSIAVASSGTYSVTVTNGNGCSATSAATAVTMNAPPDATITANGPTTFCEGGSVTLSAPAGNTYLWSNGATTQSIVATTAGSYSVTVTNASGCSTPSAATSVTVNALPNATIAAGGPTTFCEGASVTLTASSGTSWLWSNGATTQSITVGATGSYSVTVTNGNGCTATSAATDVTVNALPDATITPSGPTTFCEGSSVTLSAPAGLSYLWSTGATTQSITVSASGSYSVTVTNGNGCSATSTATNVTVNALPDATVTPSGPTTFCEGGNVTLSAPAGQSYLWSTGATTQSINVTAGGSYSVTVTNGNGCSATSAATTVTVNALPSATITPSGPTTFCQDGNVTLTASAGSSYLWSTGATTQSINVTVGGSYRVTVTNANGCNATSPATTVTVNALPSATITPSGATTFCQGGNVTLTASAGSSYLWSTGATTQSINVTAGGSYSVTVTNANGCSATSAATTVTVNSLPNATITPSGATTFCQGGNVTLTASAGTSYLWSTGATTQSINVTVGGSYSVTVTNANGCSATSAATTVTVNALPSATITPSGATTFCQGGNVTLTASAGSSYLWSTGATTQSINVTAGGSYSVTVTNANGCSATSAATTVTVNALPAVPTITAGGPTTFCAGGSVTLTAPAGFTYLWSNGATTRAITATASGSYSVTVTNASGCSRTSAATAVTVTPATAISQQPQSQTIPRNTTTSVSVTATGTGTLTYQWYRGNSGTTSDPISGATTASYTTPRLGKGTYRYWVRVTGSCGTVNSATATITVP